MKLKLLYTFLIFGYLMGCSGDSSAGETQAPEDYVTRQPEDRTPTPVEATTLGISIGDATIPEGNESTSLVEMVVDLALTATETISVQWSTEDGSAKAGEDYVEASGELTFNPGEVSKVIRVSVAGDIQYADDEADEHFRILLTNPVNAEISDPESLVTIINDDKSLAEAYSELYRYIYRYINGKHASLSDPNTVYVDGRVELDLDEDNDLDIVLLSSTTFADPDGSDKELVIYRNLRGAGFSEEVQSIRASARDASIQDFNGDGMTDLFLADHGLDMPPYPGQQDRLLLQDNSGQLIDATESYWPDQKLFSHSACEGDVDSDGDFDINVSTGDVQFLYINDGTGAFTDESAARLPLLEISGYLYQAATEIFIQSLWDLQFYWCEMADINLDGAVDIVLGDHNNPTSTDAHGNIVGNSHLLLLNDGTGIFRYSYPDSLIPNATVEHFSNATVEMKSFNANLDTCPDLATVSTNYTGEQVIAIFVNDCAGNLRLSDTHRLTNILWTDVLFVLDANGDQLDDLFTGYLSHITDTRPLATPWGGHLSGGRAFINNGDGTFQQRDLQLSDLYLGGPGLYLALRTAGVEESEPLEPITELEMPEAIIEPEMPEPNIVVTGASPKPPFIGSWEGVDGIDGSKWTMTVTGSHNSYDVGLLDDGSGSCGKDDQGNPLYSDMAVGTGTALGNELSLSMDITCQSDPPSLLGRFSFLFVYDESNDTLTIEFNNIKTVLHRVSGS